MRGQDRRRSFKTPPVAETAVSQHARREKALEEQKRKRAERIESSRQVDAFASLSLGPEDDDLEDDPEILHEGVARLASLLSPGQSHDAQSLRKERKANARFANKIMYAELLEMKDNLSFEGNAEFGDDGLPNDLETHWIALAPVPRGKRCLAVSSQSVGVPGVVSTFLKSRLKGYTILNFPSPLPPFTILDCILDENWKKNGILHVLDVIRWKGQDIADCETTFRFWWRDTRLSEILALPPVFRATHQTDKTIPEQVFSYPTLFLPVPYHTDLSYSSLLSTVIPASRSVRIVQTFLAPPPSLGDGMDLDQSVAISGTTEIQSDGILLYVSQASYDSGTTPLSSWIPAMSLTEGGDSPLYVFERLVSRGTAKATGAAME